MLDTSFLRVQREQNVQLIGVSFGPMHSGHIGHILALMDIGTPTLWIKWRCSVARWRAVGGFCEPSYGLAVLCFPVSPHKYRGGDDS